MKPINFVPSEVARDPAQTLESQLPGLEQLWARTLGDPRICIAVLDGPVDLAHPSLRDAAVTVIDLDQVTDSAAVSRSDHGTHVTSIIFGSHDGPVKGIAPQCRGLIIPIFRYAADGTLESCSQERLAKAIRAAARFGANVINISAGQFSSRGEASAELRAAVESCGEDVLIVSAAGNDGCDCLHVPGALPPVLAVGAMDAAGRPMPFSNWGAAYRERGILAPGEMILGAAGNGGVKAQSGTSFAAPIVSGVAGLLLSLQQKLGVVPSSKSIRNAILETTHGCDPQTESQCERVLAGRLSISGSVSAVTRGSNTMPHATNNPASADAQVLPASENSLVPRPGGSSVEASACCGGCADDSKQFVYAIGELQYDFQSVIREQSVQQSMEPIEAVPGHIPHTRDSVAFLRHLFGYQEVSVEVRIGDIKEIKINPTTPENTTSEIEVTIPLASDETKRLSQSKDVGRQIGFSGLVVGEDKDARLSILNSCDSMIIKTVLEDATNKVQIITIATGLLVEESTFDYTDAHYYIPQDFHVTRKHAPQLYDASAVIWKLNRGKMEVYGIVPDGNFAESTYRELAEFYMNQCGLTEDGLNYYYYKKTGRDLAWEFRWDPRPNARKSLIDGHPLDGGNDVQPRMRFQDSTERVAIPGVLQGEVRLITGVRLPAIKPDMRGTAEWSEERMLEILLDALRSNSPEIRLEKESETKTREKIRSVLQRLDNLVRNPGLSPEHRALNHAATRLFGAIGAVAVDLFPTDPRIATDYELEDIVVKRSEIGYAGSDCWDVEVYFFNPTNIQASRVVVVQTIDVNDTIPALTDKPRKFRRR